MKVTVFNGSPRGRESNSHQIVAPLLEGAREAGAQVEEVFLVEKDIQFCRGCFVCWGKTPGRCALKDDMAGLIDLFLESDYVGMATPVYGMYMTAVLKNFTDRLLPLAMPHIKRNEDGTFYHEGRTVKMPRQFFITNSGFPGKHNFDLFKAVAQMQDLVLEIYRDCGEALQEEGHAGLKENINKFREALKKAGREMVTTGQVSPGTVQELHRELVSEEEYMAWANRYWDEEIQQSKSRE